MARKPKRSHQAYNGLPQLVCSNYLTEDFHIIVGWGPPCDQSWTPCVISFLKHSLPQGKRKSQVKF